jgi:hypothetical protein
MVCSWKNWCMLARLRCLLPSDRPTITVLVGLILLEDVPKMKIAMLGPFWRDWESSFSHPFRSMTLGRSTPSCSNAMIYPLLLMRIGWL